MPLRRLNQPMHRCPDYWYCFSDFTNPTRCTACAEAPVMYAWFHGFYPAEAEVSRSWIL
jgi:hypothetical protein